MQLHQPSIPLSPRCCCVHFRLPRSILHNGLLAASGTRLQTTGAVFGVGIYLSTDFNVAYSFSKAQQGWAGSSIGRHLRCVLLCEVSRDVLQQGQSSGTAQGSSRCGQQHQKQYKQQLSSGTLQWHVEALLLVTVVARQLDCSGPALMAASRSG